MTTADRFRQIERVYLAALDCDGAARGELLDRECAGDAALRRDVESLLAQEPHLEGFLDGRGWLGPGAPGSPTAGSPPVPAPVSAKADADQTALAVPPIAAGSLFAGRYRIVRPLGQGGMGVVYQAEDVRLKRFVALKFLGTALSSDPAAKTRFLQEAQAAAALDDPHVCTVYEADEDQGRAYLAMAFIDGPTLKDRIASGPLPVDEVVRIAKDIASGLAAAHASGIVHRDIKPGNVLLDARGLARITDFGVARLEGRGVTGTASLMGTPAYMSPEQVQGLPADRRSDLWSLGCVIYEMLSGRSPFCTASGQTDVFAIVHGPAPAVTAFRPDVPPSLAAVIDRCLRNDLGQRYQDAASVVADLESVARGDRGPASRSARADLPSVAVLPFTDMSPDRAHQYFADGIAEEIIHALTRLAGLRVVARTSSFALRGKELDVREIGRLLNVGAVLEGSVRAARGRFRVTAQLINVADGFHLWSERFDREEGDVFEIQDEITASIVERLAVALQVGERAALLRRRAVDPHVYSLYLKGRYFGNTLTPEGVETAFRLFAEALAADPSFAPAHAAIAMLWGDMAGFNLAPHHVAWPKARAAAEQALALDPDVSEAHVVLGGLSLWYDWDWPAAEARSKRALALNPGDANARGRYAWLLLNRRRYDDCCAAIRQALDADPLSPLLYGFSIGLHAACGRGEEALAVFQRAVELAPNFALIYFHAAVAYTSLGRLEEAAAVVEEGIRRGLTVFWADCILGIVRAKQGRRDEAQTILARMIEQHERLDVSSASIAWVAACLGDFDTAFTWLEHGYADRDGLMGWVHVYTDLFVPALARDPRYRPLIERMRLADVA